MKSIVEQYKACRRLETPESDPPRIPVLGRLSRSPVQRLARSYRDCAPAVMVVSHSRFAAGYVLDQFFDVIDSEATVIRVEQAFDDPAAFMHHVVNSVGFGARATSLAHLEHAFGLFLAHQKTRGLRTVLAIPDIDAQGTDVLVKLRDWIDLESENQFGLMTVATGPAHASDDAIGQMLEAISRRSAERVVLTPFVLSETREFIRERFEQKSANGTGAAGSAPRFEVYAVQLIHELSAGVPETVDLLCRKSLALAACNSDANISTSVVKSAARVLGLMPATSEPHEERPATAHAVPDGDSSGRLIVKIRGEPQQAIALNGGNVLIGRDRFCDICLEDAQVSRLHGLVARAADRVYYLDLGSTNGSVVNGAETQRLELVNNDVIAIGDVRIIYSTNGSAGADDVDLDATDIFEIPDFAEQVLIDDVGPGARGKSEP